MIRLTLRELFTSTKNLQAIEQWEHKGNWVPRQTLEDIGVLDVEEERKEVL